MRPLPEHGNGIMTTDNCEDGIFFLTGKDFTTAGAASSNLKAVLERRGIAQDIIRRTAIAAFEAEMNVVIYAVAGMMKYRITDTEISVTVQDMGPGIPNIELAMTEGFSTAPDHIRALGFGSGMGLPNIRKNTDNLSVNSNVGEGTTLEFVIQIKDGQ